MAVLGGVGYKELDEYITSSKLSKMEQEFFAQKNEAQLKFSKSFVDQTGIIWSVDDPSTSSGYLNTGFAAGYFPKNFVITDTNGITISGKRISIYERRYDEANDRTDRAGVIDCDGAVFCNNSNDSIMTGF